MNPSPAYVSTLFCCPEQVLVTIKIRSCDMTQHEYKLYINSCPTAPTPFRYVSSHLWASTWSSHFGWLELIVEVVEGLLTSSHRSRNESELSRQETFYVYFLVLAGKKTISILASNHLRIRELEKNEGQPFCFTVCNQSVSMLLVCHLLIRISSFNFQWMRVRISLAM